MSVLDENALHDLTGLQQGLLVASGDLSPLELAEHYLDRASRLDDVGAFVTVAAERALAAARELTTAGRPADAGPLWGVPTAVKDLNATAGVPTAFGSAAYTGFVPDVSDSVTRSLEDAGLVWLGKTATPEFGSPCYTEPEGAPAAVTPWDRSRMAGGSSGGAGAAVAAGLVPLAQGSDGGGSIRIPASCCGLVGFKPSRGLVSGAPLYGEPTGLATSGPLARTVGDAAALLDVLAVRRAGDPYPPLERPGSFLTAAGRAPGRLRVARFSAPVIADAPVHPEVLRAWESASALLASLGHEVVDVEVPLPREAVATFETCWAVLTALSPAPAGREHLLRPLTTWLSARGRAVSGPDFGLALGAMRRHAATALEALAGFDAVLTPTLADVPLPVGAIRDDADPASDFEAQKRFTPYTSLWNVTGSPAVSLPLHETPDGLPVGVMLAGRPGEDGALLALAAQVEAVAQDDPATAWHGRRPPGWERT
ncbi:amidase [Nocardioides sp. GY 10127]|uniref:amidase n=1 Tax=Nocardioides sp. GY 10127 TaxID=2569762 RepID=UPI0010A8F65B|nr:amidase [Nocardioides sp. GY 10127]TIC80797.1 amidase [Nocardioides sp. GY 10127]